MASQVIVCNPYYVNSITCYFCAGTNCLRKKRAVAKPAASTAATTAATTKTCNNSRTSSLPSRSRWKPSTSRWSS